MNNPEDHAGYGMLPQCWNIIPHDAKPIKKEDFDEAMRILLETDQDRINIAVTLWMKRMNDQYTHLFDIPGYPDLSPQAECP